MKDKRSFILGSFMKMMVILYAEKEKSLLHFCLKRVVLISEICCTITVGLANKLDIFT
jgi:hypothetical protein